MTQTGLTKILTFSPFYIIQNDSKFSLEYKENVDTQWHRVEVGEVSFLCKKLLIDNALVCWSVAG